MIKIALFCIALVAFGSATFVHSSEFLDELASLSRKDEANDIPELGLEAGFDSQKDLFFFSDKAVAGAFARDKFRDTKITMAGQQPDLTGAKRIPAAHPFAVAQKSLIGFGVSSDRWDIKESRNGVQYLAVYHGTDSDFVVNKVRAHLVRRVADAVKEFLPMLDQTAEQSASDKPDYTDKLKEGLRQAIVKVIQDVDYDIRASMKDNDDSAASATMAIITKHFVIVANVGTGRVLAYDSSTSTTELTGGANMLNKGSSLFGMRKSRAGPCQPFVEIFSRYFVDDDDDDDDEDEMHALQFLLLETPQMAEVMDKNEMIRIVLSEVKAHKSKTESEQELFAGSVTSIMKSVADKVPLMKKIQYRDQLVMMVALETDYSKIH